MGDKKAVQFECIQSWKYDAFGRVWVERDTRVGQSEMNERVRDMIRRASKQQKEKRTARTLGRLHELAVRGKETALVAGEAGVAVSRVQDGMLRWQRDGKGRNGTGWGNR